MSQQIPVQKTSFLVPKIAAMGVVVCYGIALIGTEWLRYAPNDFSGSSCSMKDVYEFNTNCIKALWHSRASSNHLYLLFRLFDVFSILLMLPVFIGFQKLIKDKDSSSFMIGCVKIACLFNVIHNLFNTLARTSTTYRSLFTSDEHIAELEIAYMITSRLLSWMGSVDELMMCIAFLYIAALGHKNKFFAKSFNILSLLIGILAFLAFIFGMLYFLADFFFIPEMICSLIYLLLMWGWMFYAFYIFQSVDNQI
ncbi:hypothetical protein WA158_007793 [Blastocystis sp. Blastoise]